MKIRHRCPMSKRTEIHVEHGINRPVKEQPEDFSDDE
jgi:hypothetical protein